MIMEDSNYDVFLFTSILEMRISGNQSFQN
jgi:hypothetical protein